MGEGEIEGSPGQGGVGIGLQRNASTRHLSQYQVRVGGNDQIQMENEFPANAAKGEDDPVPCAGRALFVKHLTNTSFPGTADLDLRGGGIPSSGGRGRRGEAGARGPAAGDGRVRVHPGAEPKKGFC